MNCKLCKKLKVKKLKRLNRALEKGDRSIEALAERFNLPPRLILHHWNNCLGGAPQLSPTSGVETLQIVLERLLEDMEIARDMYYNGDDDEDGNNTSAAIFYQNLAREVREYAASIEKMRPTENLVSAVHVQVIAPMLSELAKILVEEGSTFDSELRDLLGNRYDPKVKNLVKETWKKISTRFFLIEANPEKIKPRLTSVIAEENAVGKKKPQRKTAVRTSESEILH